MHSYQSILEDLIEESRVHISEEKPSDWYERNMVMPPGSARKGPFSYDPTPHWREIVDCADKNHPARQVTIMGGAQFGKSAAVLNPIIAYTIAVNPGNTMFLTGHSELSDEAMAKIEYMIHHCGLSNRIKAAVQKAKNSRTGDTMRKKEFPGGNLIMGSVTNHNLLRQFDVMIMIVDDYDAAAASSKFAGSTRELVDQRTAAYEHKKKIFWVSSPQIKGASNIETCFMQGDQRYRHVPCPCCGEMIVLQWQIQIDERETAGITWKLDDHGNLDTTSVGYICQKCSNFFTEKSKYEMNLAGVWIPSEPHPKEPFHQSYQVSCLYSAPFMKGWPQYVQQYITANPAGAKKNHAKNQTFYNIVLGLPYEQEGETPKATDLMRNTRAYEVGTVPEAMSIKDGNGRIILLTCAADLNGVVDDARLDYEIVGWSESGASYSITHGSIGTFIPRENTLMHKEDRERWTYNHGVANSVWPELDRIIISKYPVDTGRAMRPAITGVDTGFYSQYAWAYIDSTNQHVVGVRGDKYEKFVPKGYDTPLYHNGKERTKLYQIHGNQIKDQIAAAMQLSWVQGASEQPPGFMNYPTPSGGRYNFTNFFEHYEAEHKITQTKDGEVIGARWEKKTSVSQNHCLDTRVYNIALREIFVTMIFSSMKPAMKGGWAEFCALIPK